MQTMSGRCLSLMFVNSIRLLRTSSKAVESMFWSVLIANHLNNTQEAARIKFSLTDLKLLNRSALNGSCHPVRYIIIGNVSKQAKCHFALLATLHRSTSPNRFLWMLCLNGLSKVVKMVPKGSQIVQK
jgi:hypothetical protein